MKKTIFAAIIGMTLMSFAAVKYAVVKFTEPEISYHWQNINQIKTIVDQSSLPHNQVVFIIQSLDSLQRNIQKTVSIDSTIKK